MLTIGLVGCGAIGSHVAQEIQRHHRGSARLIGLYDKDPKALLELSKKLSPFVPARSPEDLARRSQLLVETASHQAVRDFLPLAIRYRRPMMILSTGAAVLYPRIFQRARLKKIPIFFPSGALGGIDALKASSCGRIQSVVLTTRKPLRALGRKKGVAAKPMVLFYGTAEEAVRAFPKNINVAATLSLAGIGPRKTKVRVIADPLLRRNIHEVEVRGDFGRWLFRTENKPFRENPKTSRLAAYSVMAMLRDMFSSMRIGT